MAQSVVKTTFSAGLALAVLLPTPESASADVVKLADRPALTGVDVTDFVDGAIRFRGAANLQIIRPLAEVDWLDLEQSPAFSDAELARVAGEMATALEGYLAVTERPPAPWVGRLAQTRVIQLSDDAGRFDAAVALYVEMLLSSPEADVSIRPRRPGPGGGDLNRRARQTLLTALEGRPKPRTADALRSLLLEIGLVDGLKNPLDFVTESETAPAKPGADLPALFGPERRSAAVSKAAVYLPTNSMIWSLASERVTAGDGTGALQLLDAAREWTRPSDKETARLLRGRALLALGRFDEVVRELRSLCDSADRAIRDAALYHVGFAARRGGDVDLARAAWSRLAKETKDLRLRSAAQEQLQSLPSK